MNLAFVPSVRALAALAMAALVACGGDSKSDGPASVDDLKIGSCVTRIGDAVALAAAETSPCTAPHRFEVVGQVTLGDAADPFPGRGALLRDSYRACVPLLERYTGAPLWSADLDIETITPSVRAWAEGTRSALCLAGALDREPLTASVRQIAPVSSP